MPSNREKMEEDLKSSATLWLTRVMICMISSRLPYFDSISHSEEMNQEPLATFLQE